MNRNALHPGTMMLALDPDQLELQLMLVDDHSTADTWSGRLTGDIVVFAESAHGCWGNIRTAALHCPRRLEIVARPESRTIKLGMSLPSNGSIDFALHRLADDKADGLSKKP